MSGIDPAHRDTVSELFRAHYGWLHTRLCRYLNSSSYAEDIAADTFTQLLCTGQGTVIREPRALLTTIAQRLLYQMWRRRKVEQAYLRSLLHDEPPLSPSPEALVQVHQALQVIDALLEGLPDKVRATFVLSRVNGLTYPEIALKLGISQRSVSEYMTRALNRCVIHGTVQSKKRPSITRESA